MSGRKMNLAERRRKRRVFFGVLSVLFFAGLFVGVWYAIRLPEITVTTVEVSGANRIASSEVEGVVWNSLAGSYAFLIPRENSLFYPRRTIEDALITNFPAIERVTVNRDDFTTLSVSIEERNAVAMWCPSEGELSSCALLDASGLLFETAHSGAASTTLLYESHPLALGEILLGGDFPRLHEIIFQIAALSRRIVERVSVDGHGDVFVRFHEGGELRFVRTDDPALLLENIASVFSSDRFMNGEAWDYVDFRFGSRAYVKFKNE